MLPKHFIRSRCHAARCCVYSLPVTDRRIISVSGPLSRAFSSRAYLCDEDYVSKESRSPFRPVNWWSSEDKALLWKLYQDGNPSKRIQSQFPARSKDALKSMLRKLKIHHESVRLRGGSNTWKEPKHFLTKGPTRVNRWSSQDKDLVYRLYKDKKSIEQIHSYFPTRSQPAIRAVLDTAKADHGDTDVVVWTADYLQRLKAMREGGATWKRIQAEAFPDQSLSSISYAYQRFVVRQVPPESKTGPWTEQNQRQFEELIREGKSIQEIWQTSFPEVPRRMMEARSRKFRKEAAHNIPNGLRLWTADEEKRLIHLVANSFNVNQIGEMMHRSVSSVNRKAQKLGLKALPAPKVRHPNWTAEEIAVLKPYIGVHKFNLPLLKESLPNRSLSQISVKRTALRKQMGITRALKRWTTEEVSALWSERAQGLSLAEVAQRHGCSNNAVSYQLMEARRARQQHAKQQEGCDTRNSPDNATIDLQRTS